MTGPGEKKRIPRHVAIIMDGNGRWARQRGLPRLEGHRAGAERVRPITTTAADLGVEYLTLYTFSTENWRRPRHEISGLMRYLRQYLKNELPTMMKNNVRFQTIGHLADLSPGVRKELKRTKQATADNDGLTLVLALNYGGREEIVRAARLLAARVQKAELQPEQIDETLLAAALYTGGMPDPDLLIRTSGEMRLSNFLLWQASYTELVVTEVLWPDFAPRDLEKAIEEFNRRSRRFGGRPGEEEEAEC